MTTYQDFTDAFRRFKKTESLHPKVAMLDFSRFIRSYDWKNFIPEIAGLRGIPQDINTHPEIDTLEHTFLVAEQAYVIAEEENFSEYDTIAFVFASMMHDVGKYFTLSTLLPQHKGHEEKGAEMLEALVKDIQLPVDVEGLVYYIIRDHSKIRIYPELSPRLTVKLYESWNSEYKGVKLVDVDRKLALFEKANLLGRLTDEKPSCSCIEYTLDFIHLFKEAENNKSELERLGRDVLLLDTAEKFKENNSFLMNFIKR